MNILNFLSKIFKTDKPAEEKSKTDEHKYYYDFDEMMADPHPYKHCLYYDIGLWECWDDD